jgi:hypothetical protein
MIIDPAGIHYFSSVEDELGRVSHIAKQTLGYYREHASASSVSLADIVLHAITIYEPRCIAAEIGIRKSIVSSRKSCAASRGDHASDIQLDRQLDLCNQQAGHLFA